MIHAALLADYEAQFFNSMPHIHDVEKLSVHDEVVLVKKLVFAHGLSYVVSTSLTHKHFDVQANERVVARADVENSKIHVEVCVPSAEGLKQLVPFQFRFCVSSGIWIPLAYWDVQSTGGEKVTTAFKRLVAAPDFLHDFAALSTAGDISRLCVTLRFQNIIAPDGKTLLERTDVSNRSQVFTLRAVASEEQEKSMVLTHWFWNGTEDNSTWCNGCCEPGVGQWHD